MAATPTETMQFHVQRNRRRTTGPDYFQKQLERLDKIRRKGHPRPDERQSILRVFFPLHHDSQEQSNNSPVNARTRTSRLCGVSTDTVGRLLTSWTKTSEISSSTNEDLSNFIAKPPSGGNTSKKSTRVPDDSQLFYDIRDFIQTKRIEGTRVCAPDVLNFLVNRDVISISKNSDGLNVPSDYRAALSSVQRYIHKKGLVRRKRSGTVKINCEHIAWRNEYIRTILSNRSLPRNQRLREVYTDESYVHHHHQSL